MGRETDGISCAADGSEQIGPSRTRTAFPAGTTARIFRRSRSAMSSGAADTRTWRLTFRAPGRRFIEPVMGWTGSTDPLSGLELKFPTLEAALRYARRQGLDFVMEGGLTPTDIPAHLAHKEGAPAVVHKHAA